MIGYKYISRGDVFWKVNQGILIPLSQKKIENFTEKDALQLLKITNTWAIRWETDIDESLTSNWWRVLKHDKYDFGTLKYNVRRSIRIGLENFYCKIISKEFITYQGYDIYVAAFKSYSTYEKKYTKKEFSNAIQNLSINSEFFGIFNKKTNLLVGFSENFVDNDICFFNSIWIEPSTLKSYAGYILFHSMHIHYLNERSFSFVSNGMRSIGHKTNIHDFLISKFSYKKKYYKLNIVYRYPFFIILKILLPFMPVFSRLKFQIFSKITVILKQERIRMSCFKL